MKDPIFQTSTLTPGRAVVLLTPVFLVWLLLSAISGWLLLGGLYLSSWLVLRGLFLPASVELSERHLLVRRGALKQEFITYKEIEGMARAQDHHEQFVVLTYTKRLYLCLFNKQQEELFLRELQTRRDEWDARR